MSSDFPMDLMVLKAIDRCSSVLVSHYLVGGFCYEVLDCPVMSDGVWDNLCEALESLWEMVDHPHKDLIDPMHLSSATASWAHQIKLPERARMAVCEITGKDYNEILWPGDRWKGGKRVA